MNPVGNEAADLAVQGTNTSSITSKRSLERLGYMDHCHVPGVTEKDSPMLLKYVVPKPSRRSPVINRAYFQRTDSIRILVEGWIQECESLGLEECAVISLGCGFDPTYFRLATLRKNSSTRARLRYVDIDYPTLITERLYMVRNQPKLLELFPKDATTDDVGEFISSTYSCLGIDLRNIGALKKGLESTGIVQGGKIIPMLIVSEVVLSYLRPLEADAVIQYFAGYPEATFILHEQVIPRFDKDEEENYHPFASTMFDHFERTMTPLRTVRSYKGLETQKSRLGELGLGWKNCDILNLNLLSEMILLKTPEDHKRICGLEPFDEYDEQYWIGAYYFVAILSSGTDGVLVPGRSPDVLQRIGLRSQLEALASSQNPSANGSYYSSSIPPAPKLRSRAASAVQVQWSPLNPLAGLDLARKGHTLSILGDEAFIFGGFGADSLGEQEDAKIFQARAQQARLGSMIRYNLVSGSSSNVPRQEDGPAPRMHHSAATTLDGSAFYVYGGRDGPTKVHNDVWRYTADGGWDPLWRARISPDGGDSFPKGLFKHTANMMTVAGREMMVVLGGRLASGEANNDVWAFDAQEGQWGRFEWQSGSKMPGIFSHSSVVLKMQGDQDESLVVVGGIRGEDEKVIETVWKVCLTVGEDAPQCSASAQELTIRGGPKKNPTELKPRFGHSSVVVGEDRIWVLGGVSSPGLLQWSETMIEINPSQGLFEVVRPSCFQQLIMVGHATALDVARKRVIGAGGGGTCFGFGAWWDSAGWGLEL